MTQVIDPMVLRWTPSRDGFCESHCGTWYIEPRHPGYVVRRETEHGLEVDGVWCPSQKKAKAHAQSVHIREQLAKEDA